MTKNTQENPIHATKEWRLYRQASTEEINPEEENLSKQQVVIIRELSAPSSIPIGQEYIERASGTNNNRSAIKQTLEDAHDGNFSHTALYGLDRLSRDWRNAVGY